jgi:hypothetical protein
LARGRDARSAETAAALQDDALRIVAKGKKEDGAPRSPLRTISSFGKGEARPQQLLHASEVPAIEGREQVEARDETLGVKADVEARRLAAQSAPSPGSSGDTWPPLSASAKVMIGGALALAGVLVGSS